MPLQTFRCILFVLCCLFFSASAQAAGQSIAVVIAASGSVTAQSASGTRTLAVRDAVYAHDTVVTAAGSSAQLLFNDDTTLDLAPESSLAMEDFAFSEGAQGDNSFSVRLATGMMRLATGEIVKRNPDAFAVKTEHATIGIRGTMLSVKADEKQTLVTLLQLSDASRALHVVSSGGQAIDMPATGNTAVVTPQGIDVRPATEEEKLTSQMISRADRNGTSSGISPAAANAAGAGSEQALAGAVASLHDTYDAAINDSRLASADLLNSSEVTAPLHGKNINDGNKAWDGQLRFTLHLDSASISGASFYMNEAAAGADGVAETSTQKVEGYNGAGTFSSAREFSIGSFSDIRLGGAPATGSANFSGMINPDYKTAEVQNGNIAINGQGQNRDLQIEITQGQ